MSSGLLPPANRTHLGLQMTESISPNTLHLQRCQVCNTVQYPPREVCVECLGEDLPWCQVDQAGTVLATSQLQHCLDPYFAAHKPWSIGSIKLDCGPVVLAHIASDCTDADCKVWVIGLLDSSKQGVLAAISQSIAPDQTTQYAQRFIITESLETS